MITDEHLLEHLSCKLAQFPLSFYRESSEETWSKRRYAMQEMHKIPPETGCHSDCPFFPSSYQFKLAHTATAYPVYLHASSAHTRAVANTE